MSKKRPRKARIKKKYNSTSTFYKHSSPTAILSHFLCCCLETKCLKPRFAKINEAFVASCFFQWLAFVLAFHEKNCGNELQFAIFKPKDAIFISTNEFTCTYE